MNIFFGAQIVICIQLDFAAACVFVYFEYIQIFIFSLHSMAAHTLRMNFHKPLLSHTFTFMTSTHRQSFTMSLFSVRHSHHTTAANFDS